MPYGEFTFPEVLGRLALSDTTIDLYGSVPALPVSDEFARRAQFGATLALTIGTEKARSEFLIAPILQELLSRVGGFGLFSGVDFNVDAERRLNGVCDFILTREPLQMVVRSPIVAIAEAKNDNLRYGLGQCIAAMVAARDFNAAAAPPDSGPIHGVVTTGTAWKFLRLDGAKLLIDLGEYNVPAELGRVMGILAVLVALPAALPAAT